MNPEIPLLILRPAVAYYESTRALAKTIRWCRSLDIREVWMFPHRGHAEPIFLSPAQLRERCGMVRRAARAFRTAGISPHANLFTMGMRLSPQPVPAPNWQAQVEFNGKPQTQLICPLDPRCLRYLENLVGKFAATGVDAIWIDDDFRFKTSSAYCFCPLHIRAFNKQQGTKYDRASLVKTLKPRGLLPTGTAEQWNDFQRETLLESARAIRRAVDRVNPNVRLGSMCVRPYKAFYGADFLSQIIGAFAGPHPPMTRPDLGGYNDHNRLHWDLNTTDAVCACYSTPARNHVEIECWPYTRFRSAARPVQLQIAESLLHGQDGASINLHEYNDIADRDDDNFYGETLGEALPVFRALRELVADKLCVATGIRVWSTDNACRYRSGLTGGGYDFNSPRALGRLGLPLAPDAPQAHVLTANSPIVLQAEGRLEEIFAQGVLVDVDAAQWLIEMGRSDLIGNVRLVQPRTTPVIERILPHAINGKWAGRLLSLEALTSHRLMMPGFVAERRDKYTLLSRWEDRHGRVLAPGIILRESPRGRVALVPYSLASSSHDPMLTNWKRQQPFRRLFEWLGRQPLSAYVEGAPDLFVHCRATRSKDRIIVGVTNRSFDLAGNALLSVAVGNGKYHVQLLDDRGHRKPVSDSHVRKVGGRILIALKNSLSIESLGLRVFILERSSPRK